MPTLPNKTLNRAKKVERKPDTKSRKQLNTMRYVTSQNPTRKASLNTGKPS